MAATSSRRLPPSIGAASTTTPRPSSHITTSTSNTPLPAYEPLSNPLTDQAQLSLQNLPRTHPLTSLRKHQDQAINSLTDIVGIINDLKHEREAAQNRVRNKSGGGGGGGVSEDAERELATFGDDIEDMSLKLDEGIRRLIDGKAGVEARENALRQLEANVSAGGGIVAPTQSTLGASQARSRQRMPGGFSADGEEADDNEDGEDFGSTQQPPPNIGDPPSKTLKRKLDQATQEYSNLSLQDKYSHHNDYISFRKVLHDARNPGDDAPPLPHSSTWFQSNTTTTNTASSSKAKGKASAKSGSRKGKRNARHTAAAAEEDADEQSSSDNDIQIASEKRSIRCPLTLQPMTHPLSSKKCPHSFEKSAIMELLSQSDLRLPVDFASTSQQPGASQRQRPGGIEKATPCPECNTVLREGDLVADPALLRKIQRVRRMEERRDDDDDDDDDDDAGNGHADGGDIIEMTQASTQMKGVRDLNRGMEHRARVKAEKVASSAGVGGGGGGSGGFVQDEMAEEEEGVPATQIVELDDEEEEEEEDEEEEGVMETQMDE